MHPPPDPVKLNPRLLDPDLGEGAQADSPEWRLAKLEIAFNRLHDRVTDLEQMLSSLDPAALPVRCYQRKCLTCRTPFQVVKRPGRRRKFCCETCRVQFYRMYPTKSLRARAERAIDSGVAARQENHDDD